MLLGVIVTKFEGFLSFSQIPVFFLSFMVLVAMSSLVTDEPTRAGRLKDSVQHTCLKCKVQSMVAGKYLTGTVGLIL